MPAVFRCVLLVICAVLITASQVHAEDQNFGDLLARAKAEAAAGHRWAPPGDNMTETVIRMMDLVSAATPAQLAELGALLDSDKVHPAAAASGSEPSANRQPAEAITPPAAETVPPPASAAVTPRASDAATPSASEAATPSASEAVTPRASETVPSAASDTVTPPALEAVAPPASEAAQPSTSTASLESPPVAAAAPAPRSPMMPERPPRTGVGATPTPNARAAVLFARGLDAENRGDFSGARRIYLIAAQQGDGAAARHLGRLYDPAYISQAALGGIDPDPALARQWYERAVKLGDSEARPLLEALTMR